MLPRLCTLVLAASTAAITSTPAHAAPVHDSHVRCLDNNVRQIFRDSLARSATIGRLVSRIERSDVVVFLVARLPDDGLAGKTQFVSSAPGARYVLVTLDPRAPALELIGRLGHELQHVAEIAEAPAVKGDEDLRALLSRIGWRRSAESWETQAAIETGRQASREAASRPSHVGDIARQGVDRKSAPVNR
jgi:hypothetical protein